jgi:hypothetical protein
VDKPGFLKLQPGFRIEVIEAVLTGAFEHD